MCIKYIVNRLLTGLQVFLPFLLSFTVKITIIFYSVVHKSFKVIHFKKNNV